MHSCTQAALQNETDAADCLEFCLTGTDVQSAVGSVGFCLLLRGGVQPALMGRGGASSHLHQDKYIIKRTV